MAKNCLRVFAAILLTSGLAAGTASATMKCGDQNNNGTVTAGDALAILRVSVGSFYCDNCVCDANQSNSITAGDALMVLKFAVGQPIVLKCPPCPCDQTPAPQCGGQCEGGRMCAVSPWDDTGNSCECVTACEISEAPACGGGCEGSEREGDVCTHVTFTAGSDVREQCECMPPGTKACSDTSAPQCGGICGAGHECRSQSGKCKCVQLPVQGPCAEAEAPACAGTCGPETICQPSGDTCVCGPHTGEELCEGAAAPMCGTPCGEGRLCAAEVISGCACFEPCGVANAPTCNGSCLDAGQTCTNVVAKLGNSTVNFCECH